ncbi:hydrolase [Ponticaulis sp.]|uniref:hydrolase n=1 Tax=Ponticaulis sp. TaxID=2020902 RepID=UPI002629766A|nr:hydrolase [Ponticaulis sp.]MDF1681182.1 hydrolase [Ponticaulis sp.]
MLDQLNETDKLVLAKIAGKGDEMCALTVDWSRVNSGSWNAEGLRRMVPLISQRLSILPGETELIDRGDIPQISAQGKERGHPTGPVIRHTCRQDAPVQIVFTGHYDTVFPPSAGFDDVKDIGEGKLNGPGLADMKGGLIVMTEALRAFEETECAEQIGYRIVISPDEEIGNPVSAEVIHETALGAHVGMTYEPALESGDFAGERKGSGNFSLVIKGISAHAGRAHADGRSAVLAAAKFVVALESLNGVRDGVTFNTGKIEGGGPNNQVPDLSVVRFNVRVPDQPATDWAQENIDKLVSDLNELDGISAHIHGGFYRPPKPFNAAQQALFSGVQETGRALGLELGWVSTGGVCEGNNVFAAGVPNIDTLGVRGGRIHSTEEFVVIDSFEERASLSALILCRLAEGRMDAHQIKKLMEGDT